MQPCHDVHLFSLIIQACLLCSDAHLLTRSRRSTLRSSFCAPLNPACGCYYLIPPPFFFFLPSPVFSPLPSLPVGQSEDRSDGSSSGSGAGAGPGESSVLLVTDALGVFLLINGHRSDGRTRSPCRQWEVWDVSSADEDLNCVWTTFTWRISGCDSCDVGETESELHR